MKQKSLGDGAYATFSKGEICITEEDSATHKEVTLTVNAMITLMRLFVAYVVSEKFSDENSD
jgi:hypothetical protein